jgi:hypothetical protein
MAADMQLLELITLSFLHLTLNITGWATLLEQFCASNGFHLKHEVSYSTPLELIYINHYANRDL